MLKKRIGFSFVNNGDTTSTNKTNVSSPHNYNILKILRYNTIPITTKTLLLKDETIEKRTAAEPPEDILADSNLFSQQTIPIWKRKRIHFIIGLSVGLLIAAYGASTTPTAQTHLNDLQSYLQDMDLSRMISSNFTDEIFGNLTNYFTTMPRPTSSSLSDQSFMPALTLKDELDLKPHHPVVLIPGIISSGLESWGTSEKSRKFFRKRMWGTTTMFRSVLLDKETWTQHLKLDPVTGLDPPGGVKVRAAQGLDAADYFVTGYWIWAKIIENLAYIGYDNNNMYLASYDWRLSFYNLEVRDQYFSKLKSTIETSMKATNGVPAVIVTHSMGASMFPYFLRWVQDEQGGNGGSNWTERHIASFVNIAGPMVGVPKALTAMLSGETRDTMSLGSFGAYLLEKFFSRRERASLLRTWAGGSSMLPKGGILIWGTRDAAPDDQDNHHSYGNMISFTKRSENTSNNTEKVVDHEVVFNVNDSLDLLYQTATSEYTHMLATNYSLGISVSKKELEKNNKDHRKWSNPLESQLPIAPSMKIYCMYGVGLPTERSYYYTRAQDDVVQQKEHPQVSDMKMKEENDENATISSLLFNGTEIQQEEFMEAVVKKSLVDKKEEEEEETFIPQPPPIYIDGAMHQPDQSVETGVRFTDGDGTVPLLSLGYMCAPSGGWTKYADLYNPGHSPVILKEYIHEQSDSKLDVRGGSKAGDHVDILGNWDMTLDILQIVSNKGSNVTSRIISNIENYVQKINIIPLP